LMIGKFSSVLRSQYMMINLVRLVYDCNSSLVCN
jgi:hypothetical protein